VKWGREFFTIPKSKGCWEGKNDLSSYNLLGGRFFCEGERRGLLKGRKGEETKKDDPPILPVSL